MKWSDYLIASERTLCAPGPVLQRCTNNNCRFDWVAHADGTTSDVDPIAAAWMEMIHGVTSIKGELYELSQATTPTNQREERGDAFWYVAAVIRPARVLKAALELRKPETAQMTLPSVARVASWTEAETLAYYEALLSDAFKRGLFYGSDVIKIGTSAIDGPLLVPVWHWIEHVADALVNYLMTELGETEFELTLARNIAKLHKRYPEKFTEWDAENRDLAAELLTLEA